MLLLKHKLQQQGDPKMNIAYLTKILDTTELDEVVGNFDAPALDMNLAIWAGEEAGEIETESRKWHD